MAFAARLRPDRRTRLARRNDRGATRQPARPAATAKAAAATAATAATPARSDYRPGPGVPARTARHPPSGRLRAAVHRQRSGSARARPRRTAATARAAPSAASYGAGSGSYGARQLRRVALWRGLPRARLYGRRPDERGFLERAGDEIASWFGDEDAARRREQDHPRPRPGGLHPLRRAHPRGRQRSPDRGLAGRRAATISVTVENGEVTLDGTVLEPRAEAPRGGCGRRHLGREARAEQPAGAADGDVEQRQRHDRASSGFGTGGTGVFGDSTGSAVATASNTELEPDRSHGARRPVREDGIAPTCTLPLAARARRTA